MRTTLNPTLNPGPISLSDDGKTLTAANSYVGVLVTTHPVGKSYLEYEYFDYTSYSGGFALGVAQETYASWPGNTNSAGLFANGSVFVNSVSNGDIYTGDIPLNTRVCMAVDRANNKLWFRIANGSWNGNSTHNPANGSGGFSISTLPAGNLYAAFYMAQSGGKARVHLGADEWMYEAPSGYLEIGPSSATLNPFDIDGGSPQITNAGKTITSRVDDVYQYARMYHGFTGKIYAELETGTSPGNNEAGLMSEFQDIENHAATGNVGITISGGGSFYSDNMSVYSAFGASTSNTRVGIAVDVPNGRLWARVGSGLWNNSATANPANNNGGINVSSIGSKMYLAAMSRYTYLPTTIHTAAADWSFTAPDGFGPIPHSSPSLQFSRTFTKGRTANASVLTKPGQLAINTKDLVVYSTDGQRQFEIGSNNTVKKIANSVNVSKNTVDENSVIAAYDGSITISRLTPTALTSTINIPTTTQISNGQFYLTTSGWEIPSAAVKAGGSNTMFPFQYNDSGVINGSDAFIYDISVSPLGRPKITGRYHLTVTDYTHTGYSVTGPATVLGSANAAGLPLAYQYMENHPQPYFLQAGLNSKRLHYWAAQNGSTALYVSGVAASNTGAARGARTTSNAFETQFRRLGAGATGNTSATYEARTTLSWSVSYSSGGGTYPDRVGGFLYRARAGISSFHNGCRGFIGMHNSGTAIAAGALNSIRNAVGFGFDPQTASSNNLLVYSANSSAGATYIDLGTNFPASDSTYVYDFYLYVAPGSSTTIRYMVVNLTTHTVASGLCNATCIPASGTVLNAKFWCAASTIGNATSNVTIEAMKVMVETEY